MLRDILNTKFGKPTRVEQENASFDVWHAGRRTECSILIGNNDLELSKSIPEELECIYGGDYGAFLCGRPAALKVASCSAFPIYGLYFLNELSSHPAILKAKALKPDVIFFMDAANIYYYGLCDGRLYVFDLQDPEVFCLGPVDDALSTLIDEWSQ